MSNSLLTTLRTSRPYVTHTAQWLAQRALTRPASVGSEPRILLIPADPWTLTGSRGDEAMIHAVVDHARNLSPSTKIAALTASDDADRAARALGIVPLQAWGERWRLQGIIRAVRRFGPTAAYVFGADVMDGYYAPITSIRFLMVADIIAQAGIPCTILGFSFNRTPPTFLRYAFDNLHRAVSVNVRDEVSLRRFRSFSRCPARLVADAAFMLEPKHDTPWARQAKGWADEQRNLGRLVLALNVHPMLVREAASSAVADLTKSVISELLRFTASQPTVSLMLLAHDDRGPSSDHLCLAPIANALLRVLGERLYYSAATPSAPEAKACVSYLDGLVTGRMHLAIAALGSGVPVSAITYQDKFQGLFKHFGLPESHLLAPDQIAGGLAQAMDAFVHQMNELRALVAAALPGVKALSRLNVESAALSRQNDPIVSAAQQVASADAV